MQWKANWRVRVTYLPDDWWRLFIKLYLRFHFNKIYGRMSPPPPPFPQLTKAVTACRQISLTPLSLNFFLLFKKKQAQISNVRELNNVRLRMFDLATNTPALVSFNSKKREITSKRSEETDGVFIDQHLDAVWKSSITVDSRCRM